MELNEAALNPIAHARAHQLASGVGNELRRRRSCHLLTCEFAEGMFCREVLEDDMMDVLTAVERLWLE